MRSVVMFGLLAACSENLDTLPDHDGDGVADIFDSCPSKYDKGAEDRDGDGVGDACDPHLSTPGDEIVSITFFDHGFGDWVPDVLENWSITGPQAFTVGPADPTLARLELDTEAPSPSIELTFEVMDYGPTTTRRDNGLSIVAAIGANVVGTLISNRDDGSAPFNVIGVNSDLDQVGVLGIPVDTVSDLRLTFDAAGTHTVGNEGVYSEPVPFTDGASTLHASIIVNHLQVAVRSAIVYAQR